MTLTDDKDDGEIDDGIITDSQVTILDVDYVL